MPAVSKAQKKFFQIVKAAKSNPDVYKKATDNVKQVADSMTDKDITDFTDTPDKGLPAKAKSEGVMREIIQQLIREVLLENKRKK